MPLLIESSFYSWDNLGLERLVFHKRLELYLS